MQLLPLTERLRNVAKFPWLNDETTKRLCCEAADEIEQLRNELANEITSSGQVNGELKRQVAQMRAELEWRTTECDRLRAKLAAS